MNKYGLHGNGTAVPLGGAPVVLRRLCTYFELPVGECCIELFSYLLKA